MVSLPWNRKATSLGRRLGGTVIGCSSVSAGVLTLSEEFAVHGGQQLALPLAEAGVSLDRLDDADCRGGDASGWQVAEQLPQRTGLEAQGSFQRGGQLGSGRGLAFLPLPDRALGHPELEGQAALGQAARFTSAPQRLAERLTLRFGRHTSPFR